LFSPYFCAYATVSALWIEPPSLALGAWVCPKAHLMQVVHESQGVIAPPKKKVVVRRQSLTKRLLAVSAGFIVLTEALIFLPTIADFRHEWLVERFDTAELAILAGRTRVSNDIFSDGAGELLRAADIRAITLIDERGRQVLAGTAPKVATKPVELDDQTFGGAIFDVFGTLATPPDRLITIRGRPRSNAAIKLEVVVPEANLRDAIVRETWQVFFASLLLALTIGTLIYAALADSFVRPMRRLTGAITRFRAAPEDASRNLMPSGRDDEIGEAEVAFSDMQDTVRQAFMQRERLAQLGLSVSKISHDLRHSLGAAQLVSERLASVNDPVVRLAAPRLERALERAIGLAQSTLQFGKAKEAQPLPELIYLSDALEEAASEALNGIVGVPWVCDVAETLDCEVDPDHLHRILTNLIRNAGQAIMAARKTGTITASASVRGEFVDLDITDTGPGLPRGVRENLFAPFSGSGLSGGTGLGLAIARDLARMNGGDIELVRTGEEGTCFRVVLRGVGEG
jgi:signal transduction histidine kinase